jgi:hypothetical protein
MAVEKRDIRNAIRQWCHATLRLAQAREDAEKAWAAYEANPHCADVDAEVNRCWIIEFRAQQEVAKSEGQAAALILEWFRQNRKGVEVLTAVADFDRTFYVAAELAEDVSILVAIPRDRMVFVSRCSRP